MKYMVSGMKPAAKQKKPFDFAVAYESLEASFRKASEAYEKLVSAESAVAEFEQCLKDGADALESIKNFGVTPQNMSIINKGNNLDKALGMEALDMTAIESLSESTLKVLQSNYCKGLEALEGENKKSFVEAIKAFFKKILEWLKERFYGLSRLVKILDNTKIEGELDGEKKITAMACDDIDQALTDAEDIGDVSVIADAGGKVAADFMSDLDKVEQKQGSFGSAPEKKEDTVANLGYDASKAESARTKFLTLAKKIVSTQDANWKKIQAEFRKAETGNMEDPSVFDKFKAWRRGMVVANKASGLATKILQTVGMSLLAVSKAVKKAESAPAPAEPAK